jgi:prophage antirepressor-like protein
MDITRFELPFEGHPLTTLRWKGRLAWVARQVGVILGYAHGGKRLPNRILGEWGSEFQEGRDYAILTGEELSAFKTMSEEAKDQVPSRTNRGLLILFESGLHLVLQRTSRPAGVRLRRFLAEQVLPQVVRDGRYAPERAVVGGQLVVVTGAPAPRPSPAVLRELRLAQQAITRALWVDLCDRRFRSNAILRMVDNIGDRIDDDQRASLELTAAEIATGLDRGQLQPDTDADLDWQSPTSIAQALGVTVQRLGRLITRLGLRQTNPGLAKPVLNKALHVDRVVVSWLYSPAAIERLAEALRAASASRKDE